MKSHPSLWLPLAALAWSVAVMAEGPRLPDTPAEVPAEIRVALREIRGSETLPQFTLRLPACLGCNMRWRVISGVDAALVKVTIDKLRIGIVETGYVTRAGEPIPGAGGMSVQTLQFPGLAAGTYEFGLAYGMPRETESQRLTVKVTVGF